MPPIEGDSVRLHQISWNDGELSAKSSELRSKKPKDNKVGSISAKILGSDESTDSIGQKIRINLKLDRVVTMNLNGETKRVAVNVNSLIKRTGLSRKEVNTLLDSQGSPRLNQASWSMMLTKLGVPKKARQDFLETTELNKIPTSNIKNLKYDTASGKLTVIVDNPQEIKSTDKLQITTPTMLLEAEKQEAQSQGTFFIHKGENEAINISYKGRDLAVTQGEIPSELIDQLNGNSEVQEKFFLAVRDRVDDLNQQIKITGNTGLLQETNALLKMFAKTQMELAKVEDRGVICAMGRHGKSSVGKGKSLAKDGALDSPDRHILMSSSEKEWITKKREMITKSQQGFSEAFEIHGSSPTKRSIETRDIATGQVAGHQDKYQIHPFAYEEQRFVAPTSRLHNGASDYSISKDKTHIVQGFNFKESEGSRIYRGVLTMKSVADQGKSQTLHCHGGITKSLRQGIMKQAIENSLAGINYEGIEAKDQKAIQAEIKKIKKLCDSYGEDKGLDYWELQGISTKSTDKGVSLRLERWSVQVDQTGLTKLVDVTKEPKLLKIEEQIKASIDKINGHLKGYLIFDRIGNSNDYNAREQSIEVPNFFKSVEFGLKQSLIDDFNDKRGSLIEAHNKPSTRDR